MCIGSSFNLPLIHHACAELRWLFLSDMVRRLALLALLRPTCGSISATLLKIVFNFWDNELLTLSVFVLRPNRDATALTLLLICRKVCFFPAGSWLCLCVTLCAVLR